jgi:membrane-associated protein
MNNLEGVWLATINLYGVPMLGVFLLLGAFGIPFPTTLMVIASGAFIREGVLSAKTVLLVGLPCVVIGDSLSYGLGRLTQERLLNRFAGTATWQRAGQGFYQHGGFAIYMTRWLFTSIAIPTNLLAGGSHYRFDRFVVMSLFGEITWMALFCSLGYWFGSEWQVASEMVEEASSWAMVLVVIIAGVYLGIKIWRRLSPRLAIKQLQQGIK